MPPNYIFTSPIRVGLECPSEVSRLFPYTSISHRLIWYHNNICTWFWPYQVPCLTSDTSKINHGFEDSLFYCPIIRSCDFCQWKLVCPFYTFICLTMSSSRHSFVSWLKISLDGGLLTCFVFPLIYWSCFSPFASNSMNRWSSQAHSWFYFITICLFSIKNKCAHILVCIHGYNPLCQI